MRFNNLIWVTACVLTASGINTTTDFHIWNWQFWMLATPILVGFFMGRNWDKKV